MSEKSPWVWTKNNVYPKGRYDCKYCGIEKATSGHKEGCLWVYLIQLEAENAELKREAKAWLDCAVYDDDSHAWVVFEKDDEYHTLYALLTEQEDE